MSPNRREALRAIREALMDQQSGPVTGGARCTYAPVRYQRGDLVNDLHHKEGSCAHHKDVSHGDVLSRFKARCGRPHSIKTYCTSVSALVHTFWLTRAVCASLALLHDVEPLAARSIFQPLFTVCRTHLLNGLKCLHKNRQLRSVWSPTMLRLDHTEPNSTTRLLWPSTREHQ